MNEGQRKANKKLEPKAGCESRLSMLLCLAILVGGGSTSSSGAPSLEQQSAHLASICLPERLANDREARDCILRFAEHYDDSHFGSITAPDLQSSIPISGEDAPSWLLRTTDLDGPLKCLALNIYWEARNQSVAGQLAVAQVTLNRFYDRRHPNDVCEVVYDHKQFSWYWDGKPDAPKDKRAWERAIMIASAAMDGSGHTELQGVTHYHAVYSKPYWKDYMTKVSVIGDHVFYAD